MRRRKSVDCNAMLVSNSCSCRVWRCLWVLVVGGMILAPTTYARRHRGRAWPAAATHGTASTSSSCNADGSAFVPPSFAMWNHLRERTSTWYEVVGVNSRNYGRTRTRDVNELQDVRSSHEGSSALQSTQSVGTNSSSSPDSAGEMQSVEGKHVRVILTAAGGRPHSDESRKKISAANKGKKPWNVGVSHSEETRRKIAEGAREAARKRKETLALSLGYSTIEEYELVRSTKKSNSTGEVNRKVSDEVRQKLSERLKERWRDPVYRERRSHGQRGIKREPHTPETKARISEAVKERWKDPVYREKIVSRVQTKETRDKIGKVVREQWADPEIRKDRLSKMQPKSEEHRRRIAESVKAKWADPEFRNRTVAKMQANAQARIIAMGGVPKSPRTRRSRAPRLSPEEILEKKMKKKLARAKATERSRMAKHQKMMKAQISREYKREQKTRVTEDRQAARQARIDAARAAKEEEDRMLAGLDEVDALLMRQQLRLKAQDNRARSLGHVDGLDWGDGALMDEDLGDDVDEYEMPRRPRRKRVRSYEDDEDEDEELDVPEGFEMVMQNGRMVLRMI